MSGGAGPRKTLVKCLAVTLKRAACRYCGEPVLWVTSANQHRWLLFDGSAAPVKERTDEGQVFVYFDRRAVHWQRCVQAPAKLAH